MTPVEIKYLNVTWESPSEALKVEACNDALNIEQTETGWQVETCTFPHLYHTIGVRVTARQTLHPPYFQLENGKKEELLAVKVPGTKEVWWIQNSGWDKKHKRYLSELYRTAGRVELVAQQQKISLKNNTFNFTVEELEHYLADFKNNLWMLILDSNSAAKAGVAREVPNYLDLEVLKLFHNFAQHVTNITKKPGMTLSEIQKAKPLRSVRPVPRTFREYAIKPHAKELTSRASIESYDTAENRYVHYCVERVRYLLKALKTTASAQANMCSLRIQQEKKWLNDNRDMEHRQVDPRTIDNEITKLQHNVDKLNNRLQNLVAKSYKPNNHHWQSKFGSYTFQLGEKYANRDVSFFGQAINGISFKQKYNTYLVVTFPEISDLSAKDFKSCEISVTGHYIRAKPTNASGRYYYEIKFLQVIDVSIIQHPYLSEIQRLKERRQQLAADNWVVPLDVDELQERKTEREVAAKKIDLLEKLQQQSDKFFDKIPPLSQPLTQAAAFFKAHKVKKRSSCPNSMIFIQNPSYAAAKSLFKKITTMDGMNESTLNALMTIDNMGLVNVSNLYEKWCLLQIIKVLSQTYGFNMTSGWQQVLVTAVLQKKHDVEIRFEAADRQQSLLLTYEKVLASGKRPDFVIDLISNNYVPNENTDQWTWYREKSSRIVMDAKFRGEMSERYLQELITELYEKKDYSEGGNNSVYILHPTPNVISTRTSPLDWGLDCDFGQTNNHRHGAVFLSPSLTYMGTLQHVQRLIGSFLQKNAAILQGNNNRKASPDWHNMSCISCGNAEYEKLTVLYDPTKAGKDRWTVRCHSCGLLTVKTVCFSCETDLYKNGPRWTYHRTRAEQLSNVVCPSCEEFL